MSQSLWDTEPQAESQAAAPAPLLHAEELEPELEPERTDFEEPQMHDPDPEENEREEAMDPDVAFESASAEPAEEPATEVLALSSDEFTALEERVLRTVGLVKRERQSRTDAEARALAAEARIAIIEAQLQEQTPQVDRLQAEIHTLRTERDQVRQRVERLLTQLDALEL
jgi:chromosome segregation ATPase